MRFSSFVVLILTAVVGTAIASRAQNAKRGSTSNVELAHMPGTPDCFVGATKQGDPSKEASILKMRGSAGCAVPWHWHPSTENIMMVSGTARAEVQGQKPVLLEAGSFVSVPSKNIMRFACVRECTLFVYTDGPFAIHYVDSEKNEISPTEALKKR